MSNLSILVKEKQVQTGDAVYIVTKPIVYADGKIGKRRIWGVVHRGSDESCLKVKQSPGQDVQVTTVRINNIDEFILFRPAIVSQQASCWEGFLK